MAELVATHGNLYSYLFLPTSPALLLADLPIASSLFLQTESIYVKPFYSIKEIASRGMPDKDSSHGIYMGSGHVLFALTPLLYRGPIDPARTHLADKGLEQFLQDGEGINTNAPPIRRVAENISQQLPPYHHSNPAVLTSRILDWVAATIEYTPLPRNIVDHATHIIDSRSGEERLNAYDILSASLPGYNALPYDLRQKITPVLPPELAQKDSRFIGKELMASLIVGWADAQYTWNKDNTSALSTLAVQSGNSRGIANLFIALSRTLGIPTRRISGFLAQPETGLENHDWAASYLPPYGWVEVDPTLKQFADFDTSRHGYPFSWCDHILPHFTLFEKGTPVPKHAVYQALSILKQDSSWFKQHFTHRHEIAFLESFLKS